jgi:hypothetical protein
MMHWRLSDGCLYPKKIAEFWQTAGKSGTNIGPARAHMSCHDILGSGTITSRKYDEKNGNSIPVML